MNLRSTTVEGGHLAALWAFAVAQPLFDLLGNSPEFFATRGSPSRDIVAFALVVALVPPLVMFGLELLAGLVSPALRRGLHLVLVAILVAAIVLQVVGLSSTLPAFGLALAIGTAAAAVYVRLRAARSFLSVLAPAPVVFLVLFLTLSDVAPLVFADDVGVRAAKVSSRAPVVLVVVDELPLSSLLDEQGRIDPRRYPNFARLARDSSWYRNTATVHMDTPYAVPAIIDGQLPRKDKLPVAADHPRSVFSLFGGDYALHVQEDATATCPAELCRERRLPGFAKRMRALWDDLSLVYLHLLLPDKLERELPSVSQTWGDFNGESRMPNATETATRVERVGAKRRETRRQRKRRLDRNLKQGGRPARFEDFVAGVRGGGRPRLHFLHTLLPHVPFQYLPSGRAYRQNPTEEPPIFNGAPGFHVEWLVQQGYQRHLLQLGATDRLLGRLLDRLRTLGLYDRALIALVADHGVSFRLDRDRRWVRPSNVQDIAPVPFLLKAPGQRRARVSDKPLRTIDVLPTIADVLDIRIPWRLDGRSALRSTIPAQRRRRVIVKEFRHSIAVDVPGYQAAQRAALRRKLDLFGKGVHALGPNRELVGRRRSELAVAPSSGPSASFAHPERYRDVKPASGFVPVHVVGELEGGEGAGKVIALVVNGRIQTTGYSFSVPGSSDEHLSLFLPERALRSGHNRLELLWVRGPGRFESLGRTG